MSRSRERRKGERQSFFGKKSSFGRSNTSTYFGARGNCILRSSSSASALGDKERTRGEGDARQENVDRRSESNLSRLFPLSSLAHRIIIASFFRSATSLLPNHFSLFLLLFFLNSQTKHAKTFRTVHRRPGNDEETG